MIRKYILASLMIVACIINIQAQAPQKMNYQAVIRTSDNQLVVSRAVRMRISLMPDSMNATASYVETHQVTTNAFGVIQLEIGGGTVVTGTFAAIPWSKGKIFIKTETDPVGGTNYTITSTTQMMSVPYAMYGNDVPVTKRGDTITIGASKLIIPGSQLFKSGMPDGLNNGLLGSYSFTGNVNDESGNANNGVLNGATLTTDRFGASNSAYLFNGTNQNIVLPPLIKGLSAFTFSLWFKMINWGSTCIYGKYLISLNSLPNGLWLGGDGVSIGRHPETNTSNLLFGIYDFAPGIGWKWINSGVNPNTSSFYHVVGTYDGTHMRMYLNGNLISSLPYNKAIHSFADKIFIGSSSYSCSFVNAVIDDVRIYNRALNLEEIKYLYSN
jgi:hypothetical protein